MDEREIKSVLAVCERMRAATGYGNNVQRFRFDDVETVRAAFERLSPAYLALLAAPADVRDAVSRLQAWIRDFGDDKQPAFIADLRAVIDAARLGAVGRSADETEPVCERLKTAAIAMIKRHDEHAVACNFEKCGCHECTPFREALNESPT